MPDSPGEITLTASTGSASVTNQIQVKSPTITNLKAVPGTEEVTLSWKISPKCENPQEVKISWNTKIHGVPNAKRTGNATSSGTSYTATGLHGGVEYTFTLKIKGQSNPTDISAVPLCRYDSSTPVSLGQNIEVQMKIHVISKVTGIITGYINEATGRIEEGTNDIIGVRGSQEMTVSYTSSVESLNGTYSYNNPNIEWREDYVNEWDGVKEDPPNPNGVRGEYPSPASPAGDSFPVTVVPASDRGYTLSVPNESGIFIHLGGSGCRLEGCFVVDQEILDILHCATRESNITITLTHEIRDEIKNYDEYKAQYPGSVRE